MSGVRMELSRSSGPRRRLFQSASALLAGAAVAVACASDDPGRRYSQRQARLDSLVQTGLELYGSAEYALAARRFRDSAHLAAALGDRATERTATTAECVSWLRVRRLSELSTCTERLERLQRRESRSDPGVNTLIALGAIAGDRSLPPLKLPNAVAALIRDSAAAPPPGKESM